MGPRHLGAPDQRSTSSKSPDWTWVPSCYPQPTVHDDRTAIVRLLVRLTSLPTVRLTRSPEGVGVPTVVRIMNHSRPSTYPRVTGLHRSQTAGDVTRSVNTNVLLV